MAVSSCPRVFASFECRSDPDFSSQSKSDFSGGRSSRFSCRLNRPDGSSSFSGGFSSLILRFPPNFVRQLSIKARRNCSNIGVAQVVAASWSNNASIRCAASASSTEPAVDLPAGNDVKETVLDSNTNGSVKISSSSTNSSFRPPFLNSDGSIAIHAGERVGRLIATDAITTPVVNTTAYFFKKTADLIDFKEGRHVSYEYGRYGNYTTEAAEAKISALEGAETTLFLASGMCASTVMLLALVPAGGHIVTTTDCYRKTRIFIENFLPRMGIQVTVIDPADVEGLKTALDKNNVNLFFTESPTNPFLRCVDIKLVSELCHSKGALVCIDGTFATPLNQKALALGADIVLHSATKFIGGHNDVIAGCISGRISSFQSRASGAASAREVNFGDVGSRRSDSEGLGLSQKEISDEDSRFIYINDPARTNEKYEFTGNSIQTSKYSIITFLPRNLFEQFHRVAYIYFLIIAILNQLPQLAVFGRGASIMPLAIVLLVSAFKDAYEDFRRHRADQVENNRLASVLIDGRFQPKKWKHIQVGEIIKVSSNDSLPCDIVLLSTSDPTGVAYVQTINLDGESNLKTRYAKQETLVKNPEKENVSGVIKCEKPNRNIYGFLANMEVDGKRMSLGPSNIILRGCQLKNTEWAIGVVVYAGRETKAMLNNSGAPSKRSRLETQMNREIVLLSFFLAGLCAIVSTLFGIWLFRHKDRLNEMQFYRKKTYAETGKVEDYHYYGWGLEIFFTFLMCVIVFQIMIPISLYISMELVRVGQAYFMVRDNNMYDEASDSSFQCRALNINEDLGQIRYVFSDKTGTLTENKMEFRCASICGVDYSHDDSNIPGELDGYLIQVDGQIWRPKMRVKVDLELQRLAKIGMGRGNSIHDFFLALAACNTIVPIVTDSANVNEKIIDYQGESPDEQALVYAAAAYGFVLVERTSGHIVINVQGERQRFDVLGLHEFDSDRKRMSVILGCPDKLVRVFVKGADSSMLNVIDKSSNSDVISGTKSHLHKYSSSGLRTLVIGMKDLNALEFQHWQSSYESASTALIGRSTKLRQVAAEIENKLTILGGTAIEDKLQKGVPEAIESLRKAGIKVWVLTGDKQETAISIGYSSKLLTGEMTQVIINGNSRDSCRRYLQEALKSIKIRRANEGSRTSSNALIIDGTSLVYILDSELEEELFEVASHCTVVLCCRTAPLQKAGIVALIKNRTDDMTLAIGDGANDVSMIQEADVGVGISGQEGRQAVMASDFAMGQFRFLVPLLLVHGHWNYQRMAYMILYNFYRNAVFVLILFWYTLLTAYTLTTAITEWSSVLYSVIYTSFPTVIVGVLDKDLSRQTLLTHTRLYGPGQRHECYNSRLFWLTMIDTVWQSVAVFFIPLFAYWKSDIDGSSLGDLWTIAVVIVVNLHLAMDVVRWNWIIHVAIWGSIIATVVCVMIIDAIPVLPGYWAIFNVAFTNYKGTGSFWLCLMAVPVVSLVPRFVMVCFGEYLWPSDVQLAREAEKYERLRDWESDEVEMSLITSNSA